MEDCLQKWFDTDVLPSDFYELLGKPRLHPDRAELRAAIKAANRVLHGYQNHQQPAMVNRAAQLQGLVGQASDALSSDEKWEAYERTLVETLRCRYTSAAGARDSAWEPQRLTHWLSDEQDVHPQRIDELIEAILGDRRGPSPQPAAERTVSAGQTETICQSKPETAAVRSERPAAPPRDLDSAPRPAAAAVPPRPPSHGELPVAPIGNPPSARQTPRPPQRRHAERARPAAAPPDPAAANPSRPAAVAPFAAPVPGRRDARRSQPAMPVYHPPAARSGPLPVAPPPLGRPRRKLLWIIGSAVVSAVVLGAIGVMMALLMSR